MKKKSKSQLVYDYIEELVISGEIKPGERLPSEARLCELLNVSRVSVRAGIEKLSAIGLVKKKKGGGTYVNKPSQENYLSVFTPTLLHNTDYLELLEIRRALDSLSVQLCAKNITEAGVRKLQSIIEEMEHLGDDAEFFSLDKKFHLLISKYSRNRFLHNIHIIMWDVIQKALRENYNKVTNRERITEHRKIFDAIVHKDEDLAKIYTVRHLEEIIDTFVCEYNLDSQFEAIKKQRKN
ncbi:MAG: FadR/GntR family transcriptional regulator [Candidatus Izemoplasmataceae bacterium]